MIAEIKLPSASAVNTPKGVADNQVKEIIDVATITNPCKYCNQPLVRRSREQLKDFGKRRFCNRECWRQGERSAYKRQRKEREPMLPFFSDLTQDGKAKFCPKCERDLPLEDFGRCKQQKSGFASWCKGCRKRDTQRRCRRKRSTPEKRAQWVKDRQKYVGASHVHYLSKALNIARGRARRIITPFTITHSDLVALWDSQQGRCYYSGEAMTYIMGHGKVDTNISLERITPALGYIPGNVVLCCWFVNVSKGSKSIDEWLAWARKVDKHLNQ